MQVLLSSKSFVRVETRPCSVVRSVVYNADLRFILGKVREYAVGETLLDFAAHNDPFLGGTITSNRLDYIPKQSSTKITRAPEHPPMPARKFTAETVYSNTYVKKVRLPLIMLLLDLPTYHSQVANQTVGWRTADLQIPSKVFFLLNTVMLRLYRSKGAQSTGHKQADQMLSLCFWI